jgi:solute carrier family 12 (sodium/potassium/chloride transporter), member 2
MIANLQQLLSGLRHRFRPAQPPGEAKFGTFAGVFVPTVLTILGAIMYLRLGWVVGNAGLGGAIVIILLAHVITITTGLAVASIATNIRVGAGGAFSLISQSLGLEVGGSVSMPLYLAQGVSVALYVFAVSEGVLRLLPAVPEAVVVLLVFAFVFAIAYGSARLASRIQFIILAVVALSLFSAFLGSFAIAGRAGMVHTPTLLGSFPDGNFWYIFAVFFPAVTGVMAGIGLSGSLRDPRSSIPKGTMGGILVTMAIYLALAYWFSRVATPAEMVSNFTLMVDKAFWGWAVMAGLLGANFSAALVSMVAAPRVMQALGQHRILPFSQLFAQETAAGEPRPALLVTGLIVLVTLILALLSGGLNAIAPFLTMFFLITYAMLNAVVLIEQTLGMVSFRPTLAIPRFVPAVGLAGCVFTMFIINPIFSLLAVTVTLSIYGYLLRRQLRAPWEDVRSGLFLVLAEWAAERVSRMPPSPERTWRPHLLAPVRSPQILTGAYRFLQAIAVPHGAVHVLGIHPPDEQQKMTDLSLLTQAFTQDGIFTRLTLLAHEDFVEGTRTTLEVLRSNYFRPNILFLPLLADNNQAELEKLLQRALAYRIGIVLLARHPIMALGREQLINVWMREQGPDWQLGLRLSNLDLSVLLAYRLSQSWRGRINLCMTVADEANGDHARQFLQELVVLARLPRSQTTITVLVGGFRQTLTQVPRADLSVFGLPAQPDLQFIQEIVDIVDGSCIFVRDSGDESALA